MAKANRKRKPEPAPQEPGDTPTPAQLANGTYERTSLPSPDGGNRVAQVHINRGGSTVMRWFDHGRLSATQLLAIQLCYRLWALVGINQSVTASYGERIPAAASEERRALMVIEARDDLYRIQDYVPAPYWHVFENVCRFDEPAGVAGSRLGFGSRSAKDRAHTVVCMVADWIATKEGLLPDERVRAA